MKENRQKCVEVGEDNYFIMKDTERKLAGLEGEKNR